MIAVVMNPPMSGPVAAPIPPMPLMMPNAWARDLRSWKSIVVRMYTGGMRRAVPTPSRIEFPRIRTPKPGGGGTEHGAHRVDREAQREAAFSAPSIGQLAAGDHERRHDQQEERYRDLDALDRGVQILADVVDHDVHVGTGEAADELGQGKRKQHAPQRRSHPPGLCCLSHSSPDRRFQSDFGISRSLRSKAFE